MCSFISVELFLFTNQVNGVLFIMKFIIYMNKLLVSIYIYIFNSISLSNFVINVIA